MRFALLKQNPPPRDVLTVRIDGARNAGATDGLHETPFDHYPGLWRAELESQIRSEESQRRGAAPSLVPFRTKAAEETEACVRVKRRAELTRPGPLVARLATALGVAVVVGGCLLLLRVQIGAALGGAVCVGVVLLVFAEHARRFWVAARPTRAEKNARRARLALHEQELFAAEIDHVTAERLEAALDAIGAHYRYGLEKGQRLAAMLRTPESGALLATLHDAERVADPDAGRVAWHERGPGLAAERESRTEVTGAGRGALRSVL
jgi:hypothetical protein